MITDPDLKNRLDQMEIQLEKLLKYGPKDPEIFELLTKLDEKMVAKSPEVPKVDKLENE